MSEDATKTLEARLAYLETTVSQLTALLSRGTGLPINVDPPAWPWGGWGAGGVFRPPINVDPPASPWATAAYYRLPVNVDPPPWPWGLGGGVYRPPTGPVIDPVPVDFTRVPASHLEATLHSIHAEKARLASLEALITQQLEKVKEHSP